MNNRTFDTLELKEFMELASRHAQTAPGRSRMLRLRPSLSRSEICRELDLTGECVAYLNTSGKFGLSGIEDPYPVLDQLHIENTSLEPRQILALERMLFVSQDLRDRTKGSGFAELYPNLLRILAAIPDLKHLLHAIHGKILPSGELDDNASPQLSSVRKELTNRRARIHRSLEAILRGQEHAIQDDLITFRNGRFVIPVRTDSRNQVPGVVHGLSSSGQTTFVEPLTVINQNNDLVRLREQEEIETARILLSISESLRENLDAIRRAAEITVQLDVAQAKAALATEFHCVPPQMGDGRRLVLNDARHVLLEHSLRSSGAKTVPISLELDEGQVLVISGPNAGGKTVVLKTVGLISLMAQMGFHVPAREALLPVFHQVFADIGDQQSISANLSTFTAHMRNIAEMADQTSPPSLILLDEVGTGTDPDEGAAMAIAIIDYFRSLGATTIASTHYPRLKMWASQTIGVKNASVEFDELTLRPTYRLMMGVAGASSGIEIARRMHVTEDILAFAKTLVEPSNAQAREYLRQLKDSLDAQEALRSELEKERATLAAHQSILEMDYARKEKARKAEFDAALGRIVGELKAESDRAVRKIADRAEAARLKRHAENQATELRQKSRNLRKSLHLQGEAEGAAPNSPGESAGTTEEIFEGDRVKIRSLDREGTVESIMDGTYAVTVGSLRYRTGREDLLRIGGGNTHPPSSARLFPVDDTLDREIAAEINVIGLTADEALDRADKFIDQAFLAGGDTIRIIHGHGKGILRRALAGFLADHPQVERFQLAPPERGGGGATIVTLKK
jgi:DNA mismatch repair protein MutS2